MNLQTHTFRYLDRNGNGWTRQVRCAGISEALADLKSNPDAASVCSWTVSTEQTVKPAVLWSEDIWPLRLSRH